MAWRFNSWLSHLMPKFHSVCLMGVHFATLLPRPWTSYFMTVVATQPCWGVVVTALLKIKVPCGEKRQTAMWSPGRSQGVDKFPFSQIEAWWQTQLHQECAMSHPIAFQQKKWFQGPGMNLFESFSGKRFSKGRDTYLSMVFGHLWTSIC